MQKRDDLIVVLGAGVSMPCGIPGTAGLTDVACGAFKQTVVNYFTGFGSKADRAEDGAALAQAVIDALRDTYADRANFELLLNTLRWLSDYTSALDHTVGFARGMTPFGYPGVGTVFTSPGEIIEAFRGKAILRHAHDSVIRAIHEHVGKHSREIASEEAAKARERIAAFMLRLAEHFRIILVNLNYDTLADDVGLDWQDGFDIPVESKPYQVFDPSGLWAAMDTNRDVLLHLHGSVRYGCPYNTDEIRLSSGWEPVKYADSALASTHLPSRGSRETIIGGEEQGIFVLLSGLEKGSNLAYNARPYGHYYIAAVQSLIKYKRLLVMGYGGNDPHLNEWIAEHARLFRQDSRSVVISPRYAEWGQHPGRGEYAVVRVVAGKEAWDTGNTLATGHWSMNVGKTGNLALYDMTLPDACDGVEGMIAFLAGP